MRARNLKPGFFQNEYLAELPPLARILFCGLWCSADRHGRLEYRPKKIKAEILPYDDVDVAHLVGDLEASPDRFIYRYMVAGREYIQISNFSSHQEPHPREKELWPAPEIAEPAACQQASSNLPETCQNRFLSSSLNPSSLNPSSLNPSSPEKPSGNCSAKKPPKGCGYSSDFLEFWKTYPRKQEKGSAWRAWLARLKEGAKPDQLILAARHYALFVAGKDQAVMKLPATLLGPGHGPGGADPIWQEWQEPRTNGDGRKEESHEVRYGPRYGTNIDVSDYER